MTRPFIGLILILTATLSCEQDILILEEAATNRSTQPTAIEKISGSFSLNDFNDPVGTVKDNIQIQ